MSLVRASAASFGGGLPLLPILFDAGAPLVWKAVNGSLLAMGFSTDSTGSLAVDAHEQLDVNQGRALALGALLACFIVMVSGEASGEAAVQGASDPGVEARVGLFLRVWLPVPREDLR